jgi:phage tail sheath protein FI
MPYEHGVRIQEIPTSTIPPVQADSAIQVVIGAAPVNMGEIDIPLEPKLIYSYDEAKKKLGASPSLMDFTVMQTVKASFQIYNIAPIIAINVLDPARHYAAVSNESLVFTDGKAVIRREGVLPADLQISDETETYVPGNDYTAEFDEQTGHLIIEIAAGGAITDASGLSASYKYLKPSAVTKADIISGLGKIREIYPRFNLVPGLILAPGWSHDPEVYNAMLAQTAGLNGMFKTHAIVDIDTDEAPDYGSVNAVKTQNGITSPMAIAAWPCVRVGDSVYYYSALLAARLAYTDYENDSVPYVSPSNKELRISGLCDRHGAEIVLDMAQANLLNGQGIITAINLNGWKTWGNRTACYPANTDPKDSFIPIRRMFSWWGNTFILTYLQKVDDPMNQRLIESVIDSENIRANGFRARYQIADCYIEYRPENNPETDLLNGKIRFNQHLAAYPPAEEIINELEFWVEGLTNALGGA